MYLSHLKLYGWLISKRSSNFGPIGPPTIELSVLERLKYLHTLIIGEMVSQLFFFFFFVFFCVFLADLFDTCR